MSHGASSHTGVPREGLNKCPHAFEPAGFSGFGYLLGPPKAEQRSRLGEDPGAAHRLLLALSRALPGCAEYWQTPLQPNLDPDDNPFIPAGYTYLLQLVAHDVVQTSVPFWAAAELGLGSRNLRSSALLLDTLYGGGPSASTVAYQADGYSAADRTVLRLGRYQSMTTGYSATAAECPFRDLARINLCADPDQAQRANFDDPYVTCAADTRNDDNLVLAQLTALFANVHGAIADRLPGARPEAVFGYAQVAMQRIYHAVIAQDLLPRLLHPWILEALRDRTAGDQRWLWQTDRMPLEFTHGAFRVGHAMVRQEYRLNGGSAGTLQVPDVLNGGALRAETRLPLRETWLVQWSQFFQMPGAGTPNLSRRVSPTQSALDTAGLFRSADEDQPDGLSLRDMLSGALARTWHVDALLGHILAHNSNPIPSDWIFYDSGKRQEAIRSWLSTRCTRDILNDAQIDTLSADPPLLLFVLLESALDPEVEGRHLGPLGSIIIGEVIGRSVARERQRLSPMECVAKAAFEPAFWDEMMAIGSMPALIRFAARHCGFATAPVAFI
jgi:Animal haem peroxidase